jgi:hypothetical protein
MSTTEASELALGNLDPSRVMSWVTAELNEIAAAVDRAMQQSRPTMELLEASRAIRNALVSLSNWSGSRDDGIRAANPDAGTLTLQEAWAAARLADPLDARRSTGLDA